NFRNVCLLFNTIWAYCCACQLLYPNGVRERRVIAMDTVIGSKVTYDDGGVQVLRNCEQGNSLLASKLYVTSHLSERCYYQWTRFLFLSDNSSDGLNEWLFGEPRMRLEEAAELLRERASDAVKEHLR
ncbi:hypothetical protein ANCDUO_14986, partial [Ancylostoma duodenale]